MIRRAVAVVCWLALVPLAFVVAARDGVGQTHTTFVFAAAASTVLLAPVWLVLLVALVVVRRPGLVVAAACIAALHATWTVPLLPWARDHVPAAARSASVPRLRVFSANVFFGNTGVAPLAAEIRAFHPDVVVLQEASPTTLAILRSTGVSDSFPYRFEDPRSTAFGTAVWSRHPLEGAEVFDLAGFPEARTTVVLPGDVRVRLYDVHTRGPFGAGGAALWHRQLVALRGVLAREPAGPLVVAGDFNASRGNAPFRALLRTGSLRDAHEAVGFGLVRTWPRNRHLPALVQLDHVLVSRGVVPLAAGVGDGRGSDHRPITAVLAVTR